MNRQIRIRAAVATAVAIVAAGTFAAGVSVATPAASNGNGATAGVSVSVGKPSEQKIAALFDQWNAALQTGDPKKVAARYCSDAVLLPTASPKIRTNSAEITDYFEHFLEKKPQGTKKRTIINVLDGNSAIDQGLYVFTLTDPKTSEKSQVEARYNYAYEKRNGTWCIANHHSSVLPPAS